MTDVTETAIDAAEAAIDSYLDEVDPDDVDTRVLAENVVMAIDNALAGAVTRALNDALNGKVGEAAESLRLALSLPPSGFVPKSKEN